MLTDNEGINQHVVYVDVSWQHLHSAIKPVLQGTKSNFLTTDYISVVHDDMDRKVCSPKQVRET